MATILANPSWAGASMFAWAEAGMPPGERIAVVPPDKRFRSPLARHTLEELTEEQFRTLVAVLGADRNWADLVPQERITPEAPVPERSAESGLSILEKDLQRVLGRNLGVLESGLKPSPDYQLEEYLTDVGRVDLFCVDKDGMPNWMPQLRRSLHSSIISSALRC